MKILVCGGAGYIGSHMAKKLLSAGLEVVVFDNLSTGNRWAVKWGDFYKGDLLKPEDLSQVFSQHHFAAVMHFSARSLVAESVVNPSLYYQNNVVGTLNLLNAMRNAGVGKFIFSSSAATFGNPVTNQINEMHAQHPINPYGWTKLMVEQILLDYAASYNLRSVSLRYFNAAGADPDGEIGESHEPETHLIPNILKALAIKKPLKIFGSNYPTPDGTCVRDYIHVNDLCDAHLLALRYLDSNEGAYGFNLGNGRGFSIFEVIKATEEVVGKKIYYDIDEPRPGDPPVLVADSSLIKKVFGWQLQYTDIHEIIETAWNWERKLARPYPVPEHSEGSASGGGNA